MRKITTLAHQAFIKGEYFKRDNTEVTTNYIALYGHRIIERIEGKIHWSLCGWNTPTTRERLSPFVQVRCKKDIPYVNGVECWKGVL
jgi:hypothetical protein